MLIKKSVLKDALREISLNKKRFALLIIIVTLSVGFYVGFTLVGKDVSKIEENYYRQENLMDIKVSATNGFLKDDYDLIKNIDGINGVMLVKSLSVKASTSKDEFSLNAISINENRSKKNNDYINRLTLTSGRYPRGINEGLAQESFLKKNNLSVGDLITLKPNNKNDLKAKKIKIVGTVKSKYETKNGYFIYLEERDFNYDYYNELYITLNNKHMNGNYTDYVSKYKQEVKKTLTPVLNERYNTKKITLENNIYLLQESLDEYNNLPFPEASLTELIIQASKDLQATKKELANLKKPELLEESKEEIPTFKKLKTKIKEIKKISSIFPILFLLVGCISSSLLTIRKINEDKKQIMVLKVLGYKAFSIFFKYVLYTFLVSLTGCIVGALLFYKIIPITFKIASDIPGLSMKINLKYTLFASLLTITLNVLLVTLKSIYLNALSLKKVAKQKPDKQNDESILDKTFIWKKLSHRNQIILKTIKQDKIDLILMIIIMVLFSGLIISTFTILNENVATKVKYILLTFTLFLYLVTLYCLLKDNINDLKKEISTLLTLGFYDYEISKYLVIKNMWLVLISLAIGIVFDALITCIIIKILPCFSIRILYFLITIIILFAISLIISLVTHFNLKTN